MKSKLWADLIPFSGIESFNAYLYLLLILYLPEEENSPNSDMHIEVLIVSPKCWRCVTSTLSERD